MKGKNLFNILGLVKDLALTAVEVVKQVKTIRKKKKNDNKK